MSTSVYKVLRQEKRPLLCGLLSFVGGAVYQLFSHDVGSLWMTLCFVPSLGYAALDWFWISRLEYGTARDLTAAAAATATAGMVLCGILQIAGGESPYVGLFWLFAGLELAAALLLWKKRKECKEHE